MNAPGAPLRLATLNFQDGGFDPLQGRHTRLPLLAEVVAQVPDVDIFCMQECFRYTDSGSELAFAVEDLLAPLGNTAGTLRVFLTHSTQGPLHQLIAVRWPRVRPVRHYTPDSPGVYHDQLGCLDVRVEDWDRVLHLMSVQWPYFSGDARLVEAQRLARYAASDSILAGDWNSLWPEHPVKEPDWSRLPPHNQHHKTLPPGVRVAGRQRVADRRALTVLAEAGFTSAGVQAADFTPTVGDDIDAGQGAPVDHILVSPSLAAGLVPGSYRVWANRLGDRASDHRLVSAELRLPPAGVPS